MGKPRMIILIRHAQSEGNLNRDVHQIIPDHRVKLTPEGKKQASEAGKRLRELLRPDDTIRLYTSPYRRTRETAEGLLSSLTATTEELGPSPFQRKDIIVREEPRLREQDFGNFQPCSAEMERMWQERADYGHFFYRIPNGESAADAYDRISGFNDSLWRSFSEDDFPSVLILVTHGLMTRVFLMRWFHYTVETFEDLRNINHCEFVIMHRSPETEKFVLENKLRTWSELKRRATLTSSSRRPSSNVQPTTTTTTPAPASKQWGGCVDGCNHHETRTTRRRRTVTESGPQESAVQSPNVTNKSTRETATPTASKNDVPNVPTVEIHKTSPHLHQSPTVIHLHSGSVSSEDAGRLPVLSPASPFETPSPLLAHIRGRDAGGSLSGMPTPTRDRSPMDQSDSDTQQPSNAKPSKNTNGPGNEQSFFRAAAVDQELQKLSIDRLRDPQTRKRRDLSARASPGIPSTSAGARDPSKGTPGRSPRRKTTREDLENWMEQSGMGRGTRADPLGDAEEESSSESASGSGSDTEAAVARAEAQDRSLRGSVY